MDIGPKSKIEDEYNLKNQYLHRFLKFQTDFKMKNKGLGFLVIAIGVMSCLRYSHFSGF